MIGRVETGEWDPWPLTRLLMVGVAFSLLAHFKLGWNPHLRDMWELPGGVVTIFLFIVAFSSSLAHVCLIVASIPVCGLILLNDWLYDSIHWTCRVVLRIQSQALLATVGLCGEIVLFGLLAALLYRALGG